MDISNISSSVMDTVASAVDALIPNTVGGRSPQVTSNASPFDGNGASTDGSAKQGSGGQRFLSNVAQFLQSLIGGAQSVLQLIGSAFASFTSALPKH